MNGASLAEIAEVLGHKTLAMVKRYCAPEQKPTPARVVQSMNAKILRLMKAYRNCYNFGHFLDNEPPKIPVFSRLGTVDAC